MNALLRLEGLAVHLAAVTAFASTGQSWWLFAGLFFAPDLAIVAYLAGPRVGAVLYNLAHSYALLLPVGVAANLLGFGLVAAIIVVFVAHAGFDRALGYGLKAFAGFKETHLGRIA